MKTLAIDFDGVINSYRSGFSEGWLLDSPIEGSLQSLSKLSKDYEIVIHTTRASEDHAAVWQPSGSISPIYGEDAIRGWMTHWMIKSKIPEFKYTVTDKKVPAIAYIDDRAVRFTNWDDVRKMFQ